MFMFLSNLPAQILSKEPLSDRIVFYDIEASLDSESKIIQGKEVLIWRNTSDDYVKTLQFHLYLNAFKNTQSTFMKESNLRHRGMRFDKRDSTSWGWIDINSMKIVNGESLKDKIVFIQPDDDNPDDQTVIEIELDKPIKPGSQIELEIVFTSKLPRIMARTGYSNNYFLVGQWFPKIGVYEKAGMRRRKTSGWNCHQFHVNTEFYADFGVYNVSISLPEDFVVGAVGVLKEETQNNDGTKTLEYYAEDVIDFAWTASPKFLVYEDKWEHVDIRLLVQPEHEASANRYLESAKYALQFFSDNMAMYPYTTLTIVDPPFDGLASGGMEYPTFITGGALWGFPEGFKVTEAVTIHEFGHIYFMGILATNEFEEAWMDEGMNTYFENRAMDQYYGEKTSFMDIWGYRSGDTEVSRISYTKMKNPKIAEISRPAWEFKHGGYSTLTYQKTATMLSTLERLIGLDTMNKLMKRYYQKWRFKHPSGNDFIDIVNEVVKEDHGNRFGPDMNWFFDQVLHGTNTCDYKIASIRNTKIEHPHGLIDSDRGKKVITRAEGKDDITETVYKSEVTLYRMGEIKIPQEVLIRFSDGDEITESWDGIARTHRLSYERPEKVVFADIDPERKILLDTDLINNSLTIQRESGVFWKYMAKYLFWAQNAMLLY
jgi:hypothetical protein